LTTLPLNWHDSYMFSGGLEYQYSSALLLRTGVAWEKSPVRNASERTPYLPDSDRIWASLGAGYKWSQAITFDVGYAHIFAKEGEIDRTSSGVRLVADTSAHADVFSVSMKMKLGADPAPEPLK
jgi:long-chain fatty acid transport protein